MDVRAQIELAQQSRVSKQGLPEISSFEYTLPRTVVPSRDCMIDCCKLPQPRSAHQNDQLLMGKYARACVQGSRNIYTYMVSQVKDRDGEIVCLPCTVAFPPIVQVLRQISVPVE